MTRAMTGKFLSSHTGIHPKAQQHPATLGKPDPGYDQRPDSEDPLHRPRGCVMNFYDSICDLAGGILADTFGEGITYEITTKRHGVINVEGIYTPVVVETVVSTHGARQAMRKSKIDLRRSQLIAGGITDIRKDLYGATIVIDGETHTIDDPRDDRKVFVESHRDTPQSSTAPRYPRQA